MTETTPRTQRAQRISFLSLVSLVSFVLIAEAAQAPQPPPVFRAGPRLIVQTVTVKDKDGRAVEGLTAKDFVVVEDGEPQTISFVEFQRVADRRTETPPPSSAPIVAPVVPPS